MTAMIWTSIGLLGGTLIALVAVIFQLGGRIDGLGVRIDGLSARIDVLSERIDTLDARLSQKLDRHIERHSS